eukprot:TRINITY_DN2974_c0_g1_i1.p1 TRINITY_DN2974_c0_g1~~TRINITY_DN2974_c0_g1_i1.p1  ORF type:complete len:246 (+),score=74.67 TRINITY_DN2974_c0_g1_i1:28-765(+)
MDNFHNNNSSTEANNFTTPKRPHVTFSTTTPTNTSGSDAKAQAASLKDHGNKLYASGKHRESITYYTQAIELDPTDSVFFSNRSAAYALVGEHNLALEDGVKAVALRPDWNKAYLRKGRALSLLERYPEAIEALEKGLQVSPGDVGNKALAEELDKIRKTLHQSKKLALTPGTAGGDDSDDDDDNDDSDEDDDDIEGDDDTPLARNRKRFTGSPSSNALSSAPKRTLFLMGLGVAAIGFLLKMKK